MDVSTILVKTAIKIANPQVIFPRSEFLSIRHSGIRTAHKKTASLPLWKSHFAVRFRQCLSDGVWIPCLKLTLDSGLKHKVRPWPGQKAWPTTEPLELGLLLLELQEPLLLEEQERSQLLELEPLELLRLLLELQELQLRMHRLHSQWKCHSCRMKIQQRHSRFRRQELLRSSLELERCRLVLLRSMLELELECSMLEQARSRLALACST
jgi:hypothetical protein